MSVGKRLAKRSILGTKVMVPGVDDRYHVGLIQAIKTSEDPGHLTENRYSVKFEDSLRTFEFVERDLVGPGFKSVSEVQLKEGQKVFVTYNNREMPGRVVRHDGETQDVLITVNNEKEETILVKIDDVRLLESRKSARLVNSDTDFSKLADLSISPSSHLNPVEKKKGGSKAIEVPRSDYVQIAGSRKRRTSENVPDDEEVLSECSAALLLMKLSCSPSGNILSTQNFGGGMSLPHSSLSSYMDLPSPDGSSSGASSFRSPTPSPPLSSSNTDEGIVKDLSSNAKGILYQCTFPGCQSQHSTQKGIESHVRKEHLNRPEPSEETDDDERDHEEEFYYTEIEYSVPNRNNNNMGDLLSIASQGSVGLVDHMDMARPAHEDPSAQKPFIFIPSRGKKVSRYDNSSLSKSLPSHGSSYTLPVTIAPSQMGSAGKLIFISPPSRSQHSSGSSSGNGPVSNIKSPNRRPRDGKKCRKVYGLEQRDLWCTQCKWKKACARFGAQATEPLALSASTSAAVKSIKF